MAKKAASPTPSPDPIVEEAVQPPAPPPVLDHFCYFDDGTALKMVAADYSPSAGECVFTEALSRAELLAAFPKFPQPDVCCFFNDGTSMRKVPWDYEVKKGELILPEGTGPDDLAAAFPQYKKKSTNVSTIHQMDDLEATITPRMMHEALVGSTVKFSGGPYKGMTAAEAIAQIRSQIDALRDELK